MPAYRRADQPGGTYFLTLVTYLRRPLFGRPSLVEHLRHCVRAVRRERPFEIVAAVVLPDHLHWVWTLPDGDADFSSRVGRIKALFTRSMPAADRAAAASRPASASVSASRLKHRDGDVWQRRFWEHLVRDQQDLNRHLDYIHYNPVKHGLAACPHAFAASSFGKWVRSGHYAADWLCTCAGRRPVLPEHLERAGLVPE